MRRMEARFLGFGLAIALLLPLSMGLSPAGAERDVDHAPGALEAADGAPLYDAWERLTINLSLGPSKLAVGEPVRVVVSLHALGDALEDARVTLSVPEGAVLHGDAEEEDVDVPGEGTATVTFEVEPIEAGVHEFRVDVEGQIGGERYADARWGVMELREGEEAGFFEDHLPLVPYIPYAVPLLDEASVIPKVVENLTFTPAEVVLREPLPPDWEPGNDPESEDGQTTTRSMALTSSTSTFRVKVCWNYRSEDGTRWIRQPGATIQIWESDSISDDLLDTGLTDGNGCFTSKSISRYEDSDNRRDIYARILLCNGAVCVDKGNEPYEDVYAYATSPRTVGESETVLNLGNLAPTRHYIAGRQLQYGNIGFVYSNDYMRFDPGRVHIEAPDSAGGTCSGACYTDIGDEIHIPSHRDRSIDNTLHEYGHFLMEMLYDDDYNPNPGGDHAGCRDNEQHGGLAWGEGFANWFGPWASREMSHWGSADGNDNYDRPYNSVLMRMEGGECAGFQGDLFKPGWKNEASIMRALWDLTDEAQGTDFDGVQVDAQRVFHVMNRCKDGTFKDFYDGPGLCDWGGSDPMVYPEEVCGLIRAAYWNHIDLNDDPEIREVNMVPRNGWVGGTVFLDAWARDPEGCPMDVQFTASTDATCGSEPVADTDRIGIHSNWDLAVGILDTSAYPDGELIWGCAQAWDLTQASSTLNGVFTTARGESPWARTATSVRVDNEDPDLTIHEDGTYGNRGWHTSEVEVSIECTDAHSGVDELTYRVDGGSSTTYRTPFTITDEGRTRVDALCFDAVGNHEYEDTLVLIDTVPPATSPDLTGTMGAHGWYTSPVEVDIACTDASSGCLYRYLRRHNGLEWLIENRGTYTYDTDGTYNLGHWAKDRAGNVEPEQAFTLRVDTTPPDLTTSVSGTSTDGWYDPGATLEAACTDATSGVDDFRVSINGEPSQAYTGPVTFDDPGIHEVVVTCEDEAGLRSERTRTLHVDSGPPVTTALLDGAAPTTDWYTEPVTVTLVCDDPGSGCAAVEYELDGTGAQTYAGPFDVTAEGNHTLRFRSVDNLGREEAWQEVAVRVDTRAPWFGIQLSGTEGESGWYVGSVDVKMSCFDGKTPPERSGCDAFHVRVDGGPWQTATSVVTLDEPGRHTACGYATDVAGLASTGACVTYHLYHDTPRYALLAHPHETLNPQGAPDGVRTLMAGTPEDDGSVAVPVGKCRTWATPEGSDGPMAYNPGTWVGSILSEDGRVERLPYDAVIGYVDANGTFFDMIVGDLLFPQDQFVDERREGILEGHHRSGFHVPGGAHLAVKLCNNADATDLTVSATGTSWIRTTSSFATLPPHAAFTFTPTQPTTSDTVQFTDASTDADGTVVAWEWDFGDGTTSTLASPDHTYADDGFYTVRLQVWDDAGASHVAFTGVPVANTPPTAAFDVVPDRPSVGHEALFFDKSVDVDGEVVAWLWDFGDGATSTEQNPAHTYEAPGRYCVKLTVTDDDGDTATATDCLTAAQPQWQTLCLGSGQNEVHLSMHLANPTKDATFGDLQVWEYNSQDGEYIVVPGDGYLKPIRPGDPPLLIEVPPEWVPSPDPGPCGKLKLPVPILGIPAS